MKNHKAIHETASNKQQALRSGNQQAGFSLLEILVVMVIMGIMISLVAPNVIERVAQARIQAVYSDFKSIETALKIYKLDNFVYPSTEQGLDALVVKPDIDPVPRNWKSGGYLDKLPKDPWKEPYKYISPGEHGDFDIYSLGADASIGGEDEAADLGNWDSDEEE